ncbi:hypothetical protein [Fimbriiglobus ruber]|uniref:Lipoprotein n=1 Tax=Fimbriiglobus ruber TaxID=1908690 RepID=A0A225EDG0_9BACT|nr:hypothetical protein [Fimbriiglobus ruber]OWK46367.1 hypothetical protein FRUB_00066 [Fimbriiglobus ruber]
MRTSASRFSSPSIWYLVVFAVAAACGGCDPAKPRAPALVNEAVYQNNDIGLRFMTPEGWTVYSKSVLPTGPLKRPLQLVAYMHVEGDSKTDFELYALTMPNGKDLLAYLSENPVGPEKWTIQSPPTPQTIDGVVATRSTLVAKHGRADVRRDLVWANHNGRTLMFSITSPASDAQAREQAARSIASVTWIGK